MPRVSKAFAAGTEAPVMNSRTEIERLLAKHQCSRVMIGTDTEHKTARVQFQYGTLVIRFDIAWTPEIGKRLEIYSQPQLERQRWRALLLLIKAKLETVLAGVATPEEEFLPYLVMPNDRTVGQEIIPRLASAYQSGQMPKLLISGLPEDS